MSMHLYMQALTVPWQMTPEALEAMLSIAKDDPLPEEEIKRRMHGPQSLALRDGKRRDDSRAMTMRDGVAIIAIDGPIYRYADMFTEVSGGTTTEALAKDFQRALDDPATMAILFVIDSPGGEATGIGELADAIFAARGRKPMSAYIEGYGTSAAYYLASAADEVVIDAVAHVGSIGTVVGVPDPSKMVSRSINFVSSQSPKKRVDPTTQAGQTYLQGLADDMTEVFIEAVMRHRKMTREQVLAVEGAMLIGQKAVAAKLADRLGSEESTLRALIAKATAQRPTSSGAVRAGQQEESMKLKDLFRANIQAYQEAGGEIEPDEPAPAQAASQQAQSDPAAQAELIALRQQLAKVQSEQRSSEAAAFVRDQLAAGRAFPAEQAQLQALFVQLAQDDAASPLPATPTGQPTSRVALLTAAFDARPSSQMARNLVQSALQPQQPAQVLGNGTSQQEELEQLDASTKAWARQNGGKPRS